MPKKLEGHVLEPWLDYWRLSMRLEDAPNRDVREFLATHANLYVSERLRSDWLRVLGKRSDWSEFDRQAAALHARRPRGELLPLDLAPRAAATTARSPKRWRCGSSRPSCPTAASA